MPSKKVIQDFHNSLRTQLANKGFNEKVLCNALKQFYMKPEPNSATEHSRHYISFMNNNDFVQEILQVVYIHCSKEFIAWRQYIIADMNRYTRNLKKHIQTEKNSEEREFMNRQIERNNERVSLLKMDYESMKQLNTNNYKFVFSLIEKVADIVCV